MSALFIGSNIYRGSSYGPFHPLSIPRVPTVIDLARALGWLSPAQYRTSPRAKPAALSLFHTEDYIRAVQDAETTQAVNDDVRVRYGLGTLSNPVFPEMYRRPATAAGGSLMGAMLIKAGGHVFNPGGGTHHGLSDRANGFCYFNDPVLALMTLRAQGLQRILYIDVDAHHCDGVEAAFMGAEDVFLISVHEKDRWPFTGAFADDAGGAALNLPVPRGFNDSEFDHLMDHVILPAVERYAPQAVVLQCGADAVLEDPLARLALSNRCHVKMVAALKERCSRLLVLGGGGYNPWTVGRCWTAIWATLAGYDIPDRLPDAAQDVLRGLRWSRKAQPQEHHWTTLLDTPRPGPVRPEIADLAQKAIQRVEYWS
ncbi:acetoin utilization protein AcuC [Primorskyibacter sp. S187A]|uniref:acetoin utilization protein AcuC n=1 Tax=Primorskyibacter sp. S187A TaxID=3415130 RepID=UPI003C7CAED8